MGIAERVARIGTTAQNMLEVARFGGLQTDDTSAPYEVVDRRRVLMLSAEVYDVKAARARLAGDG